MSNVRIAWISVIAVFVLGIVILVMNAKDLYKGIPAEINPKDVQSSYNEWHAFTSPDGEFKVMLPSTPQNAEETLKDQRTGQMVRYDLYISEKGGNALFIIMRKTYPDKEGLENSKIVLQNFLADILSSSENTELIASNEDEFRGYDALNFAFRNKQNYVEGTAFVVDRSMYALSYSSDIENITTGDFQYFIDSFSLVK